MKKNLLKLICLVMSMVLCLGLCACGAEEDQTIIVDGLTLTLPANFQKSDEAAAGSDQLFVYATRTQVVMGLKEEKSLFESYGMDLSLDDYANLIISVYELDAAVEYVGGIPTVTFTSDVNGTTYKYIAAMYESNSAFWMLQCSCEADNFERYYEDFITYLTSVKV